MKLRVNILARELYFEFAPMIWTQMRHLGTLIPRFCTEFRYLSYGQSGLACGAIFEKCPNIKKRPIFPKYACPFFLEQVPKMSFSPCDHRQPLAIGSSRGGGPRKCREGLGGGGPAQPPQHDILMMLFHITVFPDTQVIPKWLVLQYFQRSRLYQNGWSFSISRFRARKMKF